MYTEQLYSEEYPIIAEWGNNKVHVPLNIKEIETEEEGKKKKGYLYDLVERVQLPITVDSILDAAISSKFTEEDKAYIMRNFAKENDAKVSAYKVFLAKITPNAESCEFLEKSN